MTSELTVKFYDVDHGSCTHIITPNGKSYLVDVGTRAGTSICAHIRDKHLRGGKVEYLVITHPHVDHIADIANLVQLGLGPAVLQRPKGAFPLDVDSAQSASDAEAMRAANDLNDSYILPVADDPCLPANSGGMSMQVFRPSVSAAEAAYLNNFSCVAVLEFAGFKVVLTGDNPSAKLRGQLESPRFVAAVSDATVLLAPHHGRAGEFCEEFVRVVNPRATVFSDGSIKCGTQEGSADLYGSFTRGVTLGGRIRRVLTTRNDGTITFAFREDGTWSIGNSHDEY